MAGVPQHEPARGIESHERAGWRHSAEIEVDIDEIKINVKSRIRFIILAFVCAVPAVNKRELMDIVVAPVVAEREMVLV